MMGAHPLTSMDGVPHPPTVTSATQHGPTVDMVTPMGMTATTHFTTMELPIMSVLVVISWVLPGVPLVSTKIMNITPPNTVMRMILLLQVDLHLEKVNQELNQHHLDLDQEQDQEQDLEQDLEVDLELGLDLEVAVGQVKKIPGQSELCQEKTVSSHLFTKENTTMNVLQRTLEPFPGVPHLWALTTVYRTGITVKPPTLDHLTQPQVPHQEVAHHQNRQNLKVSIILISTVLIFN